jgi:A/G-specific adenine glycosylase
MFIEVALLRTYFAQIKLKRAGAKIAQLWKNTYKVEYPWRNKRTIYRTFIAEFLLSRTRADVVAKLFNHIINRYPDIKLLAEADEYELENLLNPLGLKKRAHYLLLAAQDITVEYKGKIPNNYNELITIPGVGEYIANAILIYSFGHDLVPADVNVLRFVSRFTGIQMINITKGDPKLKEIAKVLSKSKTGLNTDALLDFTRMICSPRNPLCRICPVNISCTFNIHRIN